MQHQRRSIESIAASAMEAARVFMPRHHPRADEKSLVLNRWKRYHDPTTSAHPASNVPHRPATHFQPAPTSRTSANDSNAAMNREMAYDAASRLATPATSARPTPSAIVTELPTPEVVIAPRLPPPTPAPSAQPGLRPTAAEKANLSSSRLELSTPISAAAKKSKALVPYAPASAAASASVASLALARETIPTTASAAASAKQFASGSTVSNDVVLRALARPARYSLKRGGNTQGITRGAQIAAMTLAGGPR